MSLTWLWQNWREERTKPCFRMLRESPSRPDLLPYPIDMFPLLDLPPGTLDEAGVLYNAAFGTIPAGYHPGSIAQYALVHWNAYLVTGSDEHKEAFITQATWLLTQETPLSNDAGGWPLPFALPAYHAPELWLSASTQGNVLSVLVRAYQLSGEDAFLQAARRAARSFELDILDGGVSALVGENGIFFEEVATYPAAHILNGYILAVLGLYDYVALTQDSKIKALIEQSLTALHALIDAFDAGYWTRYDLLHKRLAPWFYHSLHVVLLKALANYSGCEHCAALAVRWAGYQHNFGCRLRYLVNSRLSAFYHCWLKPRMHRLIFRTAKTTDTGNRSLLQHVCVPITGFPIPGGMRSVLAGVAQAMGDQWQMTYLTHQKGQDAEAREIEVFGSRRTSPWKFPDVWLYCLAGGHKLLSLLHHGPGYSIILPQDGIFTGAFAAVAGKLAGVRVICMDHGNVAWLENPSFQVAWRKAFKKRSWHRRVLFRLGLACYSSSLSLLARIMARYTDQFLVAGDQIEAVYCKILGVHPCHITRYTYMVDVARFPLLCKEVRVSMRAERGIPEEAIVVTMINRLASEKGLCFALEGIAFALSALPPNVRVRVLIAGDGPLRSEVEMDIQRYGLESTCTLLGETHPSDIPMLLGISDIFLYSGTRGTSYSVAILEAMAAGCAVIASTIPQANAKLLAEERGMPIMPGDANEIGNALTRLCRDPELCHKMGQRAREYVAKYHSGEMLRRSLLRASFFAPSIEGNRDS
jgi:glycosyltransferase involved in cell wall biosynthesis